MMYGWADGWGAMVWMVLAWAVILAVLYFVVRSVGSSAAGAGRAPDAMGILDERFARGEISEQEYVERRRVLESARR